MKSRFIPLSRCVSHYRKSSDIEPVEQSTFPEKITRKEAFSGVKND